MRTTLGESAARRRFAKLIARPRVSLAEAALAIAEEEYPRLDAPSYLHAIDQLAGEVDRRAPRPERDAARVLRAVRDVLFEVHGFRGNSASYYDPRNSYLNEVMDRRLGIPITLGILYLEIADRVGVALEGVNFPGHFLVKYTAGDLEVFIDPYHHGEIFSRQECIERFRRVAPGRSFRPEHLDAVGARQILARLLHNLKKIYVETGDDVRSLWVTDRLVLLAPDDPAERRDRGLVEARLGGVAAALGDLEAYLEAAPGAEDAPRVRELAAQLRGKAPLLN
jgi:regulator of sirC expression with transglutaminase-like and TPR domain